MRVVAMLALEVALLAGCATTTTGGSEYTILEKKSPHGETIYGLACSNGTTNCKYNWDALCKTGKPYNTTPLGGKGDNVPSYAVMDGRRVRIFVCE
jgi:hypothetical protein